MKNYLFLSCLILALATGSNAQELPLVLEKHGTFEILSRTDYTMPYFGFTKAEMTANLQKIIDVVNTIRRNPVLTEMKGFDGRARIYTVSTKDNESYGVPSRISFEFAAWYRLKDGREVRGLIEPPEWSLIINKLVPGGGFSSDRFSTKPDFFTIPVKKETIEPGIDVYDGECYVIYNPNRPDYWLPVTVKEAFDVVFAENKKMTDQIQREFMLTYLNPEWEAIPKEDWNKPATFSGMASRVGTDPSFPPIMKVNPLYWDKSLPKSAIQFINFRMINNRPFLKSNTAEYLQKNSISYHEARFEESLDLNFVKSLVPLIGK
ncbi:MAG TPA: hypothetical protein VGK38_12640 [Prolixibacteraceae bacterium]|jgi:hypothetical protein